MRQIAKYENNSDTLCQPCNGIDSIDNRTKHNRKHIISRTARSKKQGNNRKRKALGSLNVAKVDAFGKVASGSFHRHVSAPGVKQLRWFLNRDAELYYFAFSKDGKKSLIVFEPSKAMVDNIRHYLPFGAYQEN